MGIIEKWKTKKEIKKLLESNDIKKLESIDEYNEDKNLEDIILSIKDKSQRAQALKRTIHKFNDIKILKTIIPTLKDDDILVILENKPEYLENSDINILYSTISGIADPLKRIDAIKKFYKKMSDTEVASLLKDLNEKNNKSSNSDEIESKKIDIITNKIIYNYINSGTILHMSELLGCMEQEVSKVKIIEKALQQENNLQQKIKNGELPAKYDKIDRLGNRVSLPNTIFGKDGIKLLILKSFNNINGKVSVERRKKNIILDLFKKEVYTYEEAREIIGNVIKNENAIKEGRDNLLKIEGKKKFVQEVKNKDLINTPITLDKKGEITDLSNEIEH